MCGRYFVDDGMERELKNTFRSVDTSKFQAKAGDVCPTDWAFILTGTKEICLTQMRWGFRKRTKGSAHQCKSGDGKGKAHV